MDATGDNEDKFDADVILSTGMLGPLLADLVDALGGEMHFAAAPQASPEGPKDSPFA
jgi:recombination associated protein RdgC